MLRLDVWAVGQIGDGAGDFQDAVAGAGNGVHAGHRKFQDLLRGVVDGAMGLEFAADTEPTILVISLSYYFLLFDILSSFE